MARRFTANFPATVSAAVAFVTWRHRSPKQICDLELIANHVCLMNCPMQSYHQNGFAHTSDDSGTLFIDYCLMRCSRSPLPECPIRVEARKIPDDFLDGFRKRDCVTMDCQTCGYCDPIAAEAVSIEPEYFTKVLKKYAKMDNAMATGELWDI